MATISSLPHRAIKSTDYFVIETEGEATARTQWDLAALGIADLETFQQLQTKVNGLKDEIKADISQEIASAYTAKGSVNFAELPAIAETEVGWVYNVKDAFDTTEDFVEGAGKHYVENTNIVATDYDGKKWDVLGGMTDLSGYALKSEVTSAVNDIDQLKTDVKSAQSAAEAAQAAADLAKQNAQSAQEAADTAQGAADKAQGDATSAKESAEAAQSALDTFKQDVKKNYIEITQASEAV